MIFKWKTVHKRACPSHSSRLLVRKNKNKCFVDSSRICALVSAADRSRLTIDMTATSVRYSSAVIYAWNLATAFQQVRKLIQECQEPQHRLCARQSEHQYMLLFVVLCTCLITYLSTHYKDLEYNLECHF